MIHEVKKIIVIVSSLWDRAQRLHIQATPVSGSVGQYQYFTSGIRYYKFKMVLGISWYFDQHLVVRIIIVMPKLL